MYNDMLCYGVILVSLINAQLWFNYSLIMSCWNLIDGYVGFQWLLYVMSDWNEFVICFLTLILINIGVS